MERGGHVDVRVGGWWGRQVPALQAGAPVRPAGNLVSNYGDGAIVAIDNQGVQTYFNQDRDVLAGMEIVGDTLFVLNYQGANPGLIGYSLSSGAQVVNLQIPGMDYLNDLTADSAGNLYITDTFANQIFRVRLSDLAVDALFTSGVNAPDGIFFDEPNNRVLFTHVGRLTDVIKAIDLTHLTLSRVLGTGIRGLDGITKGSSGHFYVSSWQTDMVYRYDPDFADPPVVIADGYTAPGDIYFDHVHDLLVVPDFYTNSVDFIPIGATSTALPADTRTSFGLTSRPNPFSGSTMISYSLPHAGSVVASIYDSAGRRIRSFTTSATGAGLLSVRWDGRDGHDRPVAPGVYFYELTAAGRREVRRMVRVR